MRPSRGSGTGGGGYETWRASTAAVGADCVYPTHISVNRIWSAAASFGAVGQIVAFPFLPGTGGPINQIAYYMTTASGGGNKLMRVGIYAAKGSGSLYPGSLLVDAGTITTGGVAGWKTSGAFAATLRSSVLYWIAYMLDHTGGNPSGNAIGGSTAAPNSACGYSPLAYGPGTSVNPQLSLVLNPYAYGACPATFPAGAVATAAATCPILNARWV